MANATQVIALPGGVEFAGFYYPEILRDLLIFLRNNRDRIGLTDENEYEAHVQMLRSFALVGHLNNTRLDSLATELFIDSVQLRESLRKLLRLIGIPLRSASPASADIRLQLSAPTSSDVVDFVPALSEFSTETVPPITYETSDEGLDLPRTDQVSHVYGVSEVDSGSSGSHNTAQPDVLIRGVGSWTSSAVGKVIEIRGTALNYGGSFRVTEFISSTQLRLVRVPSSDVPNFQTETGIVWRLLEFTSDFASDANTPSSFFTPWTTPAVGNYLYVSHDKVMPSEVSLEFNTVGDQFKGVWEYYDTRRSLYTPDSVTNLGSSLQFVVDSLLGTQNAGLSRIAITYLKTGETQWVTSTWNTSNNVATSYNLFGQTAVSTSPEDYSITSDWVRFPNQQDGTFVSPYTMRQDGSVTWTLPQSREYEWQTTEVNLESGMWFRFRVLDVDTPTSPSIDRIRIDEGDQYILVSATQGETIENQIIGSSSGRPNQEFTIPGSPFIDGSEAIEVDEAGSGTWVLWTRTDSFLNSNSTSRNYTVYSDKQDRGVIQFGDGTRGKIPPIGTNNIRATHRKGGEVDGNVGQDQITANADGVAGIQAVTNPRPAVGWRIKEGGDSLDFARIRRDGPAQTQTRGTACQIQDYGRLAVNNFVDSFGERSVKRAWAVEEKFGVKTIGLMVVGEGGSKLSSTQLSDLDKYFNGDRYSNPPVNGVGQANHKVTSVAFEPTLITVSGVVVWQGGTAEQVESQLLSYLDPLALESDGTTYLWDFGGVISFSKLHDIIHNLNPAISDVRSLTINGVSSSYQLQPNELPIATSASITITVVSS